MINKEDVVGYKEKNDVKNAVLKYILKMLSEKSGIKITRLPDKKATKIASDSSIDSEAAGIMTEIIKGKADFRKEKPGEGKTIKPLYLFLDEEILLYAKIKKLKFKNQKVRKTKIMSFLNESEKKHPELKRAVVNSLLEMYKNQN